MNSTRFALEVNPALPPQLSGLAELARNLRFSWSRRTRALFSTLDPQLWREVGGNPRLFLRCVDQARLEQAARDPAYLENYRKVLTGFEGYMSGTDRSSHDPLVAYFCAEYGFHESFQIYSGGLGVLAGDHCKTASDMGLNFIAVGLLYTQGYFTQTIDKEGHQVAHYSDHDRADLPAHPVLDAQGQPVRIVCRIAGRDVHASLWRALVGRVSVYLLDTNVAENAPADREITHKLYGGDGTVRIQQEIVLGIGGVKALRALGLAPSVWHINEGHAAFLIVELIRELMAQARDQGSPVDFATAREAVAARCVFTTHTPVAAGHDVFSRDMVLSHFEETIRELGIDAEEFLALGRPPSPEGAVGDHHRSQHEGFNMTRLALSGTRYCNGVSRIHGQVSAHLCADQWPEVPPEDNPIGYITNGVHVPTFLFQPWVDFFEMSLGSTWSTRLTDREFWARLAEVPDQLFWNVRQTIKTDVLRGLRARLRVQFARKRVSEAHFDRLTRWVDPAKPGVLTIGFARRFATYKRATLLFNDLQRFARIVGNTEQPVVFVFAGKSHPADEPARQLLREVNALSNRADFLGRIIFIEDYDIALARLLVAGVDVWLNNPISPLEASGTSGIKAAINGTLNLSVLDGWWAEGYDGENGWAVATAPDATEARDRDDARTLYELLEDRIIPLYYARNEQGFSPGWVAKCKRSMTTILPCFNTRRVLGDYIEGVYRPAARTGQLLAADRYAAARELAQWKLHVRQRWSGVQLHRVDSPPHRVAFGTGVRLRIRAQLNGLKPQDVRVEMLLMRELPALSRQLPPFSSFRIDEQSDSSGPVPLAFTGEVDGQGHLYDVDYAPPWCGRLSCQVRIVPDHRLLTHPNEMGLMKWL